MSPGLPLSHPRLHTRSGSPDPFWPRGSSQGFPTSHRVSLLLVNKDFKVIRIYLKIQGVEGSSFCKVHLIFAPLVREFCFSFKGGSFTPSLHLRGRWLNTHVDLSLTTDRAIRAPVTSSLPPRREKRKTRQPGATVTLTDRNTRMY